MIQRPKTETELLHDVMALTPPDISFGIEDDERYAQAQQLFTSPDTWLRDNTGEIEPEVFDSKKAKFFGLRDRVIGSYDPSRPTKSMRIILDTVMKDPSNAELFTGANMRMIYRGISKARTRQDRAIRLVRESNERAATRNPEWLSPQENGLVLNENDALVERLFPSGNFLYHGTDLEATWSILFSGKLLPGKDLRRQEYSIFEAPRTHGGWAGISFNCNEIAALPGTPRHISGFLAAPETLLSSGRLFVPVDAADHELQYTNFGLNIDKYKAEHAQQILWDKVIKEDLTLRPVIQAIRAGHTDLALEDVVKKSNIHNTVQRLKKQPDLLRRFADGEFYYFDQDDNMVRFSTTLLDIQISPMAVLMQAILDTGDAKDITDQGIASITECTTQQLASLFLRVNASFADEQEEAVERFRAILDDEKVDTKVRVKDLVFVCGHKDLEYWKYLIAAADEAPRAVLVFEDREVSMPSFVAERGTGDNRKLQESIRSVIPVRGDIIDWQGLLAEPSAESNLSQKKAAGAARHLVASNRTIGAKVLSDRK
jgi:hypothetical protein